MNRLGREFLLSYSRIMKELIKNVKYILEIKGSASYRVVLKVMSIYDSNEYAYIKLKSLKEYC